MIKTIKQIFTMGQNEKVLLINFVLIGIWRKLFILEPQFLISIQQLQKCATDLQKVGYTTFFNWVFIRITIHRTNRKSSAGRSEVSEDGFNVGRMYYIFSTVVYLSPCCQNNIIRMSKENRIHIRVEFTRKKCKTAILLYCFHTAGVLHTFALNNLLGPGTSFNRKSKINSTRKPNYEIGWFHNWPIFISHRLYSFHFTNDDFPLYYKSNYVFYSPNSFYKVYLTALKNSKFKWIV